jgi:hypothetical protein
VCYSDTVVTLERLLARSIPAIAIIGAGTRVGERGVT